jgi:hypothetical protein
MAAATALTPGVVPSPERYFILLRLVLGNVIGGQINWDSTERRDMAITELFGKLQRDMLQLGNPDVGVRPRLSG